MKKELKAYIKEHKLSDDAILQLISSPPAPEERDILDEADEESESPSDSNDSGAAEGGAAPEQPKQDPLPDLKKIVAEAVAEALKASKPEVKKAPPRATQQRDVILPNQFTIRTE